MNIATFKISNNFKFLDYNESEDEYYKSEDFTENTEFVYGSVTINTSDEELELEFDYEVGRGLDFAHDEINNLNITYEDRVKLIDDLFWYIIDELNEREYTGQ